MQLRTVGGEGERKQMGPLPFQLVETANWEDMERDG